MTQPTHNVDIHPTLPLISACVTAQFSVGEELGSHMSALSSALDQVKQPVYVSFDLREVRFGISDLLQATNDFARGSQSLLHHPNLYMILYISEHPVIQLAAKGLQNEIFGGGLNTAVFSTYEEAVAFVEDNPLE
ncbi:MAG: hypothetical protein GYB68_13590 [Chloroflexi bacterium]|nr:hypothetical protein [Chloroflexota bacterium]